MRKFFVFTTIILLSLGLLTSCGNTENPTDESTEQAQETTTDAENEIKVKSKSTKAATYKTPAEMKQALEATQKNIQDKIEVLQAELNGASEDAASNINKKIIFLNENLEKLAAYQEESDKINEQDAPSFGRNVALLIEKINRDVATLDQ